MILESQIFQYNAVIIDVIGIQTLDSRGPHTAGLDACKLLTFTANAVDRRACNLRG